jgi:exosortase/archaeosortase family protein
MKKRGKKGIVKKQTIIKQNENPVKYNPILILVRYVVLVVCVFSLPWIYKILTPLTVFPVLFLLKIFIGNVFLKGAILVVNLKPLIEIIPACVAGSAYLLLVILNLSVKMAPKKRTYSLILSLLILLILNIVRIFSFSVLYIKTSPIFDLTHVLFWYVLSIVFVIAIWFLMVRLFLIREIPFYSDIKTLIKDIRKNKK